MDHGTARHFRSTCGETLRRAARLAPWMLACTLALAAPPAPEVTRFSIPGSRIGLDIAAYPELVPVPGYPVYYAPQVKANYFHYDGLYWAYQQDQWYAGSWYNGPWASVSPEAVPLFLLRVPVRYFRQPPYHFRAWGSDDPPRWGEHWGPDWERRRSGWNQWNRLDIPATAPQPRFQREYAGRRYPEPAEQLALHARHYRHEPIEAVIHQYLPVRPAPAGAAKPR